MYSWVKLSHLVLWSGGVLRATPDEDFSIPFVATDTREIKSGALFVALKGENFDGHDFAEDAVKRGAKAILAERELKVPVPVIIVKDTMQGLVQIGAHLRSHFKGPVYAITGSAGKSSTKEMLSSLLGPHTVSAPASFNNLQGVSRTLSLIQTDTRQLVLEIGMNAEGEIREICSHFKPTCGLITNIGDAHIGKLGGKEGIYRAKKELFDFLASRTEEPLTRVALNVADPLVSKAFAEAFRGNPVTPLTYSADAEVTADVRLIDRGLDPQMGFLQVRFEAFQKPVEFKGALFGLHHAQNLIAAVAAALSLGVGLPEIIDRFSSIKPAKHRGEVISLSGDRVVIDESYNSNPTALHSAIESLSRLNPSRHRLVVVGDMLEMGAFTVEVHRKAGETLARLLEGQPYTVVAVGQETAALVGGVRSVSPKSRCLEFPNVQQATDAVSSLFPQRSFCFVKGSRGIQLDRLIESLVKNG